MLIPLIAAAALAGAAPHPPAIAGLWQTEEKDAIVRIADCGDAVCGVITWVDPASPGGGYDRMNADPSLRSRRVVGVAILQGLRWDGRRWSGGTIYNPKDGRSYRANVVAGDRGRIVVSGCLGPICRSNTWLRREGL